MGSVYTDSDALYVTSSEDFPSEQAAVKEAKEGAIKCLKQKGRIELETGEVEYL
jgi:hypothetical protein